MLDPYADLEGGLGVQTPLENHKNIVFLAILVRIPRKITKLSRQHSLSGYMYHRPASETPFKWRFAVGPMMAVRS